MLRRRMVVMLGAFAGVLLNFAAATADEKTPPDAADRKIRASILIVDSHDAIAKADKAVVTSESRPAVVSAARHHGRSRGHRDARTCLDAANNAAVIRCAEKYR